MHWHKITRAFIVFGEIKYIHKYSIILENGGCLLSALKLVLLSLFSVLLFQEDIKNRDYVAGGFFSVFFVGSSFSIRSVTNIKISYNAMLKNMPYSPTPHILFNRRSFLQLGFLNRTYILFVYIESLICEFITQRIRNWRKKSARRGVALWKMRIIKNSALRAEFQTRYKIEPIFLSCMCVCCALRNVIWHELCLKNKIC